MNSSIEQLEGRVCRSVSAPTSMDGVTFTTHFSRDAAFTLKGTAVHGGAKQIVDGTFTYTGGSASHPEQATVLMDVADGDNSASVRYLLKFTTATGGRVEAIASDGYESRTAVGTFTVAALAGRRDVNGIVMNDTDADGRYTKGEAGVRGATVWADLNRNGRFDRREPRAFSDADGRYTLRDVPTGFKQQIRVAPPKRWGLSKGDGVALTDVLVGKTARAAATFGLSNQSLLSGVVFYDWESDGKYGRQDHLAAGVIVYADLNNDRRMDANESRATPNTRGVWTLNEPIPVGTRIRVTNNAWPVIAPTRGYYVMTSAVMRTNEMHFALYDSQSPWND
ncbi:MAG TPA: hypothetical protein VF595_15455 [Tepidisphaeraceae bacterium]|jgi:hypothetical protein